MITLHKMPPTPASPSGLSMESAAMPARIAVISDIHACREALIATLEAIEQAGIPDILCLGDVIGYGPDPAECFEMVHARCRWIVRGNHEAMLLAADFSRLADAVRIPLVLARQELGPFALEEIRSWPIVIRQDAWEAAHSGLESPEAFPHMRTLRDFQQHFACQTKPVCFYGHTHKPGVHFRPEPRKILQAPATGSFDLNRPGRFAVGAGAVAYPRDGTRHASWVSFDPGSRSITFHQTAYDWDTAAGRLKKFLSSSAEHGSRHR